MTAADVQGRHLRSLDENRDASFLPEALIDKCTPFVVRYHELNGFSCLPDILWQPETRKLIEGTSALRQLFKKSTSSRRAQKANEGFVLIATLILSIEILATGPASWATRYPSARKKARAFLGEYVPTSGPS
ncbi:MAG TPA: hypothetical protein VKC66_29290 [Xanthobacteraceae bacterium]|nr:hypothetical protein [Xanthobacteraceae bacterium]